MKVRSILATLFALSLQAQDTGGSEACGRCHAEIYRGYLQTGMARSSGRVGSGGFVEKSPAGPIGRSPGATYRVTPGKESHAMVFERAGVEGVRELKWFIGSGKVGRSYAFEVNGFLFQAPVSYYSSAGRWDLSPGYAAEKNVALAKPIEEPCLYCHASGARAVSKTQNRYVDPPFTEGGVACERCHGRHPAIVNPAKLAAARRDSICEQCHLTGAARVARPGRSVGTFRPGDKLSDHMGVLVWDRPAGKAAASDHAEQLARSKCKAASGDRLWCGTCHDPHGQPAVDVQVCRDCHVTKGCKLAAGDDCATCHMPKRQSREGEHVAFTDHTIARRPAAHGDRGEVRLRNYWAGPAEERDLAIAYASLGRATPGMLEKLASLNDAPALAQLGQVYDAMGKGDLAEAIYERVLRLDPSHAAGANLAIYRARAGRTGEAITLWRDVFERNPALASAGLNLAVAQLSARDRAGAGQTVRRLLEFHPDLDAARQLLLKVR
jgi:predicted CXXCH cytochrome family protein